MKRITTEGGEYYVTKEGKLFTKTRGNLKKFALQPNHKGYLDARIIGKDGKQHNRRMSRLMFRTFKGEIPPNYQIDHIDNDKTNNHISNLRAVTNGENQRYKYEHLRKEKLKRVCNHCNRAYIVAHYRQKFCTPYCLKRSWRLAFKERTGSWE